MAQRNTYPAFVVLSIDGVPEHLARCLIGRGDMPHLAGLVEKAGIRQMRSSWPPVSCVAWASYMTGMNPGKHGIYGFVERRPDRYELKIANASMLAVENLWQVLSQAGKRVFGMNVPGTYPPVPVNGVLIGDFLAPSIAKAAYPAAEANYLESVGYRIDSDAALGRRDKRAMLADLEQTLKVRAEAMLHYLQQEKWDFFHTHIMGSDRLNHFLWRKMEDDDPEFAPAFFAYYRRVDDAIGRLLQHLPEGVPLLVFSDHGFCRIKREVQLSQYLVETGWTVPREPFKHPLSIDPARSRAYCLIPGRIYVNLQGREPEGIVPQQEYEETRRQLRETLLALRDPGTDEPVIRRVFFREEVYYPKGSSPKGSVPGTGPASRSGAQAEGVYGRAPDLLAVPQNGYDLKHGLGAHELFQRTELEGMHTHDDAFMVAQGVELPLGELEISMLAAAILSRLGVSPPAEMEHGPTV